MTLIEALTVFVTSTMGVAPVPVQVIEAPVIEITKVCRSHGYDEICQAFFRSSYDNRSGIIYVPDLTDAPLLVHELCHAAQTARGDRGRLDEAECNRVEHLADEREKG